MRYVVSGLCEVFYIPYVCISTAFLSIFRYTLIRRKKNTLQSCGEGLASISISNMGCALIYKKHMKKSLYIKIIRKYVDDRPENRYIYG